MRKYWPLLLVVVARLWAFHAFRLSAEDAYITFHASVDPEWMRATTSPIWAMVLSIWQPQAVSRLAALLADLLTCGLVLKNFTSWGAGAFMAFWLLNPLMIASATSGLETHIVACALICSMVTPWGLALACLRPDAAFMAWLAAGKCWLWAAAGTAVMFLAGWILTRSIMPQTVGSKLSTYGVHWFKGHYWWHSYGLYWLEPVIIGAALWATWRSKRWRYLIAGLTPLVLHWMVGTPEFWWYAVPPIAVLAALACERLNRVGLVLAVIALGVTASPQIWWLKRYRDEGHYLWDAGRQLRSHSPEGTLFLEPLGIIPWLNPNLRVVDEIGLIEPWVADRRTLGPGWMADTFRKYKPEWYVARTRFLRNPAQQFTGGGKPWRSDAELYSVLDDSTSGYWIRDIATLDGVRVRYWSCDFAILERKNLMPVPETTGKVKVIPAERLDRP